MFFRKIAFYRRYRMAQLARFVMRGDHNREFVGQLTPIYSKCLKNRLDL